MDFPARILLVDDNEIESLILERIVSSVPGWSLTWVPSGEEALRRLRSGLERWDLVLLDLIMPGMTGHEVLREIGADTALAKLPVIVLSASSDTKDHLRALKEGADEYLSKPLVPDIARARIRAVLEITRHRNDLESLAQQRAMQLAHADRLLSLGTLAAGMAHEINNPLTWISGNLQTIEKAGERLVEELGSIPGWTPSPRLGAILDELPSILTDMRGGVQRVAHIVSGLKSFSRSGGGLWKVVDLSETLRTAMLLTEHQLKKHSLQIVEPSEPVMVLADPQQIEQILVNLIANAADALEQSSLSRSEEGVVAISIWKESRRARLSVSDNGSGVPEAIRARIGMPFFTTKPPGKGTGLGLSISQSIASAHGGELRLADSERGAVFVLDLPAVGEWSPEVP